MELHCTCGRFLVEVEAPGDFGKVRVRCPNCKSNVVYQQQQGRLVMVRNVSEVRVKAREGTRGASTARC